MGNVGNDTLLSSLVPLSREKERVGFYMSCLFHSLNRIEQPKRFIYLQIYFGMVFSGTLCAFYCSNLIPTHSDLTGGI